MNDVYNHRITPRQAKILTELRDDVKFNKYADSLEPDSIIEMDTNAAGVKWVELTEEIIQSKNQSFRQSKALLAQFYKTNGTTVIKSFSDFQSFKECVRLLKEKLGYEPKRSISFI